MKKQEIKSFQDQLLTWYQNNARDLPWRRTRDPYAIWVSEIMLQQTRVATVIPYYQKFLQKFPTLQKLASAKEEDVLQAWAGLGYYSRVRNLHKGVKEVISRYEGKIPDTLPEIKTLPGIGAYTAGAILSIAFGKDESVLDGNVARVLSRVYGLKGDPRESKKTKKLWEIANRLVPTGKAGQMNQALMELGARLCSPKKPVCLLCPVNTYCKGANSGRPEQFGAREKKPPVPQVFSSGVLFWYQESYLIVKRPKKGLLGGLWELPSRVRKENETSHQAARQALIKGVGVIPNTLSAEPVATVEHIFTHLKLTLSLYIATGSQKPTGGSYPEFDWVKRDSWPSQALPSLSKKALLALQKTNAFLPKGSLKEQKKEQLILP